MRFLYCFSYFLVSRLKMPVSVPPGTPPQVLAAAEIVSGTVDILGCLMRLSYYIIHLPLTCTSGTWLCVVCLRSMQLLAPSIKSLATHSKASDIPSSLSALLSYLIKSNTATVNMCDQDTNIIIAKVNNPIE